MVVYTLEPGKYCDRPTYGRCRFWQKKKKIIFSDEAHFDLGGYVNKQNCRIWGTENSHAYIEKPTNPKRVTVWCGFWSRDTIGQFFFIFTHLVSTGRYIKKQNFRIWGTENPPLTYKY